MSDPIPTKFVPSTAVFKPDIFKGKVLFCTGGGSGICAFSHLSSAHLHIC
jgi:hypothetical protein